MQSRGFAVRLVLLLLALISVLAGCASGSGSGDVVIEMGDNFYDPSELGFQAGDTVAIDVVNRGDVEHDIVIISEVFELGFQAEDAIVDRPDVVVGRTDRVAAGQSASMTVTFDKPGEYQYFCTIFGHFYSGMTGTITVEG